MSSGVTGANQVKGSEMNRQDDGHSESFFLILNIKQHHPNTFIRIHSVYSFSKGTMKFDWRHTKKKKKKKKKKTSDSHNILT